MMGHRTDTRTDPGDSDILAGIFNPDKQIAWRRRRTPEFLDGQVKFWRWLSIFLAALFLAMWAAFLIWAPAAKAQDRPMPVPPPTPGAGQAFGAKACYPHAQLTERLAHRYGETPGWFAAQPNGMLLEVFVTEDGATWTVVMTSGDGISCVVAAGKNWEAVRPVGEQAFMEPDHD
jgi:hypothetical protein